MTPNSTQKGEITVAFVTARFLQLGYMVLRPIGESSRYDLVIDRGQGFERVQCKTGRFRNGSVFFNVYSNASPYAGGHRRGYVGQVELFAVHCQELQQSYLVPLAEVANFVGVLRVDETTTRKTKLRKASDFML